MKPSPKREKKTEQQFIDWIKNVVEFYKPHLGLSLQEINVKKGEKTNYLEITCSYPYHDPEIRFSDSALEAFREGKLVEDRILHELCHTLTDPLYVKAIERYVGKSEIEDERERLTDTLCVIIRNLIPKTPRKKK